MTSIRNLERERSAVLAEASRIQIEIDEAQRRRTLPCHHCGKRTAVGKMIYVQTHYYVSPHGCTEGDYWVEGEGRFRCPKCDYENRLIFDREWIARLKRYFASVEDTYANASDAKTVN